MKRDDATADLFAPPPDPSAPGDGEAPAPAREPLAARLRPRSFEDVVGQAHLVAPGAVLSRAVERDSFRSVILHGPPGTGKTTLARICAERIAARFVALNAVLCGVADLRRALEEAEARRKLEGAQTVVFIDELHRFNRAQQDALLPALEEGAIRFLGATTFNPAYYITPPLSSRSLVLAVRPLDESDIRRLLERALADPRGFSGAYELSADLLDALARASAGDARRALNLLEAVVQGSRTRAISMADLPDGLSLRPVRHDRSGDDHYDVVSAFIKSMRGSDLDATAYWLARMLDSGEDPRFVARRIMIQAAEDVGLADPRALEVAVAAYQTAEAVGMPEARIPLAMAALYVAAAPKSNTAYLAIARASELLEAGEFQEVPRHLTQAGAAKYRYPHDAKEGWLDQPYLEKPLKILKLKPIGYERKLIEHLERLKGRAP